MSKKTKYDCVFRAKHVSKERPRVGTPDCVKPGDVLTYFDSRHAFTTRTVESVHKNYVVVAPLIYEGHVLDTSHKIAFEDMSEALRPLPPEPQVEAPELPPEPPPEPPSEPPAPPTSKGVDVIAFLTGTADGEEH